MKKRNEKKNIVPRKKNIKKLQEMCTMECPRRVALDSYSKRKTLSKLDENYNLDIQETSEQQAGFFLKKSHQSISNLLKTS